MEEELELCQSTNSEGSDENELLMSDSICGISNETLDEFGATMQYRQIPKWKQLRRQIGAWYGRAKRRIETLEKQLQAQPAAPKGEEERWSKLRERLEEIDLRDDAEDERRRRKIAAVVESIDLVLFAQTLEGSMGRNKTEAHRIVAQLAGMLKDESQERAAPVFTWNVIALPGPRDADQESDFERQLRVASQASAVLGRPAGQ